MMSPSGCTFFADRPQTPWNLAILRTSTAGVLVLSAYMGLAFGGCTSWRGVSASGETALRSESGMAMLAADLPTRVFTSPDANTADFYMTDLPEEVWMGGADASNLAGLLIHVRLFMSPEAGRTPIDVTASTSSVRVLVLAQGELGLYGGGGFLSPRGEHDEERFGGSIRGATLRLTAATAGFQDRLGPSIFQGSFGATRDDAQAQALDRAMRSLLTHTRPVDSPAPDEAP